MRATDLKTSRKVRNGNGIPWAGPAEAIPVYLRRYETERDAWLADRVAGNGC